VAGQVPRVELPYVARRQFIPYHTRRERFAFLLTHRRAGKTVATITDIILRACTKADGRYAYIAPYFIQAKDIAWLYLKRYAAPLMPYGGKANESELSLELPNRAVIRLYGAENGERLRGIGLDGCVLDEYADFPPHLWGEVILPTLADRAGWSTFIGTAHGRMNDFYRKHQEAKDSPDWFYAVMKASETGLIPADELVLQRAQMTSDQFEQEYECSFAAAIKGAIYADELNAARTSGRIGAVPYVPSLPVHTFWDLGVGDSTAIGFAQQVGAQVHAIDYYEASGEGLQHYAKVLQDRGYVYGKHYAPHDIQVRELGAGGRSRFDTAAALGIRFQMAPNASLEDGIHSARMLLPRMWFDETKCMRWLDCLANYRWAENKALNELKSTPVHDFASHAADMTRYLAVSLEEVKPAREKQRAPAYAATGGWMR
jgi:hypothetical protein